MAMLCSATLAAAATEPPVIVSKSAEVAMLEGEVGRSSPLLRARGTFQCLVGHIAGEDIFVSLVEARGLVVHGVGAPLHSTTSIRTLGSAFVCLCAPGDARRSPHAWRRRSLRRRQDL